MAQEAKEEANTLLGSWESYHCPEQKHPDGQHIERQRTDSTDREDFSMSDPRIKEEKRSERMEDAARRRELEEEVDSLRTSVIELVGKLRDGQDDPSPKPLLKLRDIPILEKRHLKGVKGGGRLKILLSQIE